MNRRIGLAIPGMFTLVLLAGLSQLSTIPGQAKQPVIQAEPRTNSVYQQVATAQDEQDPVFEWATDCVDCPRNIGNRVSLSIDKTDHVHLAYGSYGDIYYAYQSDTGWQFQTVDAPVVSRNNYNNIYNGVFLALDAAGYPHITYLDGGQMEYAQWNGSKWLLETIDPGSSVENYTELVIGSDGRPRFAYYDRTRQQAMYAERNLSGWNVQPILVTPKIMEVTSLALDLQNTPRLLYGDSAVNICYAFWNGSSWNAEIVDVGIADNNALTLDNAGRPHIVYENDPYDTNTASSLKYAYRTETGWTFQVLVANENYYLWSSSIALDVFDNPHILYTFCESVYNQSEFEKPFPFAPDPCYTSFAYRDGSDWYDVRVTELIVEMNWASFALDSQARPHIASAKDFALVYTFWNGASWQAEQIDKSRALWSGTALVLDASGMPHISYVAANYHRPLGFLNYASRAEDSWIIQKLTDIWTTSAFAIPNPISIKLDGNNHPRIVFVDAEQVLYGEWTGSQWARQVIDVGYDPTLVLDNQEQPHISYIWRGQEIRYAWWTGSQWSTQTVKAFPLGFYSESPPSLVLDSGDIPHIVYANGDLYFFTQVGNTWQSELIVTPGYGFKYQAKLALDGNDQPHLAFVDREGRVVYAYRDKDDWHFELVTQYLPDQATLSAFLLGADGNPYLLSSSGLVMKYHWRRGNIWLTATVDSRDDCSLSDLAVGSGGQPHIGYIHNNGLHYATGKYIGFRADLTQAYAPFDVAFTNTSIGDYTSVLWDFGDGATSTQENPTHTYTSQGMYTVTLTVSRPGGADTLVKPQFITALQTVETLLLPGAGGVLSYTNLAGYVTTLEFPPGAVTQTTRLVYRPLFSVTYPLTDELAYAGQSFDLEATLIDEDLGETPLERLVFAVPVTATIQYGDRVHEETLALHTLDGQNWQDAACGAVERQPAGNWLAVPICHSGRFALVGKPERQYLPIVYRNLSLPFALALP